MKKLFKYLAMGIMFVLSFSIPFNASLVTYASPAPRVGATISISNVPSKGDLGSVLSIPSGVSPNGDVRIVITDPKGNIKLDQDNDGTEQTYSFTPLSVGTYKIQYSVLGDETIFSTQSDVYSLVVTGTRPVFSFEENTYFIIPSTIGETDTVVLPLPLITLSDGETEVQATSDLANFSIIGYTPEHTAISFGSQEIDGVVYKTFTPSADVFGIYTITYSFVDTSTGLSASKTYSIQVDDDFDSSTIDMNFTWDGSMPTTAVLGNEVTLPTPVTVDENNDDASIASYTVVTVYFVPAGKTDSPSDWIEISVDQQDFTFTPMNVAKSGSYYYITYEISNFFDLAEGKVTITKNYTLNNVVDSVAPTPIPVANYVVANMDDEDFEPANVSYLIPSKIATNTEVTLPAIFATDNFDKPSDITLSRVIINYNSVETTLSGEKNESVTYQFNTAGTYYVRYQATDTAGKINTSVSYKIVVVDGFTDTVAPRVTLPTIVSTAELGEVVTFNIPTAIDYASNSSTEQNTVDQRLQLNVYYYLDSETGNTTTIALDEDDSTKYSFEVLDSISANSLTIVVDATDDFENVGSKSYTIALINTNDSVSPSLVSTLPDTTANIDQMDTYVIPNVVFTDDNSNLLQLTISVYDLNDAPVSVKGLQLNYDGTNVTASNANFVASLAGYYTIVFTATDAGGNSLVQAVRVYVDDTVAPIIEVANVPVTAEIGVAITLPTPVIKDDGVVIDNYAVNLLEFVGSNNPSYTYVQGSMKFTPLSAGTYTFRYVGEDSVGQVVYSSVYTITASDTIKPVIELDDDIAFPVTAPLVLTAPDATTYENIEIPAFTATDANGIKEYSVVVKNPNGDEILNAVGVGNLNENNHYEFTPTKNGTYTVTYSATDNSGLSTELTYTVAVGDVTKPVITISNTSANTPSTAKVGDKLELDISSITLTDNVDGTIDEDDYLSGTSKKKFVVTLTDPDGNAVRVLEDYEYTYELSSAGTYKLVYSLTDSAGNTATKTYYIEVTADSTSATISQEVWGTVLIVASVVLLAGVVIYFVITRNSKGKKPTNIKK